MTQKVASSHDERYWPSVEDDPPGGKDAPGIDDCSAIDEIYTQTAGYAWTDV